MSHIHASKVKFRSPLVYCYNGTSLRPRNILETLDSNTCEKPKGWLSPTEFTGPLNSPGNECAQLIKRQSICQLEADASVEDIINEKLKIYTSLSQARLNLRMVQSLVPIWEEEYERSGIQEQTEQDNPNKLHPDRVLRYFLHELNYDKTLIELCMKFERMRDQRHAKSCDVSLACGDTENRSREALSSQSLTKEDLKDNDALRLLYCLASSQAEDEMVTGDELLHEAILSPLIPVNPNSMALEIAYRDYEHASQLECQDILDSVESILNLERSEEEASSFLQDHTLNSLESFIKSEGSKEHNLSSSHDILDSVSSGACNFQIHGPIDENLKTPQKGNSFEARISYGGEKANAQPGRIGPVVSSQSKEKKLLGNLPVCPSRSEHGASESFCVAAFSHDEIIDNGFYNSQFHNAEFIQYYGLRTELGSEICSKNGGMTSGLCSTRDLMRKRRSIRIEHAEAEVQIDEVVPYMLKERPTASVGEGLHLFIEEPFIGHSAILQSAKGTACSTTVCSDIHRREYFEDQTLAWRTCTVQNALYSLCTDKMQSSIVPSEITVVNQRSHLNEQLKNSIASLNLAVGDLSVLETVPLKMFEVSEVKAVGSVSRAFFCGQHRDERPGCPPSLNKCQFKLNESCTGNNALKSIRYKRWNSDFPESNNANDSDGSIPQETPFPKRPHNGCQRSTYLSDENCRDFCKEISHEIIEMTFISKPPSNGHILGPDESLPVDQTDGNIGTVIVLRPSIAAL